MEAVLVFPNQLFKDNPCFSEKRTVILIEDARYFSQFSFHKQKLIFHRASLKNYEEELKKKGYKTIYIEDSLEKALIKSKLSKLCVIEFDDVDLEKRISTLAKKLKIKLEIFPNPSFTTKGEELVNLFAGKKQFRFETFYIHQRKKLGILLDDKSKPLGGRWSFDQQNRKKIPKSLEIPDFYTAARTDAVKNAIDYIEKKYPSNPGSSLHFSYPTNHASAKKALSEFLENRLDLFGDYEDAILQNERILFHSGISPLLNTGLLTPNQVVEETIAYAKKHKVPLNSLEGFLRQVIGWREYVRGVYIAIGEKQRSKNFFNHKRKMPKSVYEGNTGIPPIDVSVKKLNECAYLHHIERLMILGNFFFLCEISPKEVYSWFMEFFIDAYDWVMVPNVYGMSQFADGGMMTTKPYFSSSSYILKMSDYPKGEWCEIWDGLFWRFMIKHSDYFEKQPRLSVLSKMAKKKSQDKELIAKADDFIKGLK